MTLKGFQSFGPSWILEEEDEEPVSATTPRLSSPVNLQSKEAIHSPNLFRRPLVLNYTECKDTVLMNTGSTARLLMNSVCDLTGGPLPDGSIYRLSEILFHWGRDNHQGSEHNVNGHAFPMEIQFVHWNSTLYPSYEESLGQPNGVANIALFVQIGRHHNGLQPISQNLWHVRFKEENKVITTFFNPETFLPDPQLRDFWTYKGSLTWSPYSENVDWILMRYPMCVSPLQMEDFRQLRIYKKGEKIPPGGDGILVDNFEPVQSLQGRVILSSFE